MQKLFNSFIRKLCTKYTEHQHAGNIPQEKKTVSAKDKKE